MKIFKTYKKYLNDFKFIIVVLMVINIISLLTGLALTYFTGRYVDLLTTNISVKRIFKHSMLILCVSVSNILFSNLATYVYSKTQASIVFKLNSSILKHVKKLPLSYFKDIDITYLNQRINADANVVVNFMLSILVNIIIQILNFSLVLLFLFKQDLLVSIATLFSIPLYIFLYLRFKLRLYETSYELKEQQGVIFSHMHKQLTNIKFTKINVLFDKLDNDLNKSFPAFLKSVLQNIKFRSFFSSSKSMIESSFSIFLFLYGGIQIIHNEMTIGSFLIIRGYYSALLSAISSFVEIIKSYPDSLVSHDRIIDILKLKKEHNGDKIIEHIDLIKLDNICFSYENQTILNDFSYTFKKGNVYLITGDNGAGKSTLIDVLLGLHLESYKGNIYYNDVNIEKLDLYFLRKTLISFLEQEPMLTELDIYKSTVEKSNSVNNKIIEHLITQLKVEHINKKLVNTKISEVITSGGEKQKIGIIRTFLKDADVLIMDEPTSALDKHSISILKDMIMEVKSGKIIIIITHNTELKVVADYIVTM